MQGASPPAASASLYGTLASTTLTLPTQQAEAVKTDTAPPTMDAPVVAAVQAAPSGTNP